MRHQEYDRTFSGCMKGLAQFLDLHQRLHIRKLKMLPYRRNVEGNHAPRNKESKLSPNDPSTSKLTCPQENYFMAEHKARSRKHSLKPSMRISISKWGSKQPNKITSSLLRTNSIHHMSNEYIQSLNLGLETSVIEPQFDANETSSSFELAYDELNFEDQCDVNKANIQKDDTFHPSKEFLAMMNLFNGNVELIRSILDDPSFIFAHYLRGKQASDAEFMRSCSFPAPGRRFESESSLKPCLEKLPFRSDRIENFTPRKETMDGHKEQNHMIKKERHRRISLDGILHRIPFGRKVLEGMKRSKFTSCNQINNQSREKIRRSQSLNNSLHHYTHLFESISNEKSAKLSESPSACGMTAKPLRRMFSLPDKYYCSQSEKARIENQPENLTTEHNHELIEKEESKAFLSSEHELSESILTEEGIIGEGNWNVSIAQEDELTKSTQICHSLDPVFSTGSELKHPLECPNLYDIEVVGYRLEDSEICSISNIQTDHKNEAKFNGHDFLEAWQSTYQPLDLSTFYKVHNFSYDHNNKKEHQLLFDLLNEALMEIRETIFGYFFPGPSHFNTNKGPLVIGSRIFEEIWSNICWNGQPPVGVDFNGTADRHFVHNDRRMNTQYDIEDVEQEVECLIVDDLLDDVVLQLSLLSWSKRALSLARNLNRFSDQIYHDSGFELGFGLICGEL